MFTSHYLIEAVFWISFLCLKLSRKALQLWVTLSTLTDWQCCGNYFWFLFPLACALLHDRMNKCSFLIVFSILLSFILPLSLLITFHTSPSNYPYFLLYFIFILFIILFTVNQSVNNLFLLTYLICKLYLIIISSSSSSFLFSHYKFIHKFTKSPSLSSHCNLSIYWRMIKKIYIWQNFFIPVVSQWLPMPHSYARQYMFTSHKIGM